MDGKQEVMVWDPLVRLFHWALVVAFFVAYLTEDDLMTIHAWAGYVVLGLVAIRVVWGFIGTRHARFSDFIRPPGVVLAHVRETLLFRAPRYLGHNPAGGLMIAIMLIVLTLTCVSGLVIYGAGEHRAGPLAPLFAGEAAFIAEARANGDEDDHRGRGGDEPFWVEALEEIHEFLADVMILLIAVHIAGVLFESLLFRENLIRSMINGRKRRE